MGGTTCFLLLVTFSTKRALFPFRPWLPLAIAAPTPISALVHSRTLVTRGLFLMIRFSCNLYRVPALIKVLFLTTLFTSFYAGLSRVFEVDIKKLIALSTLSHLGFIGITFSLGLLSLSFFHLLVHALFKSSLFMAMGDIITNQGHYQDIRYLSAGCLLTPLSTFLILVSSVNLLGLPSVSGFFSKDLILETLEFSRVGSLALVVVVANIFFTYFYTYKLMSYTYSRSKGGPYSVGASPSYLHSILLISGRIFSVIFGVGFVSVLVPSFIYFVVPSFMKFLPLFLALIGLLILLTFLVIPVGVSYFWSSFFGGMLFLKNLFKATSSRCFYSLASS